MLTNHEHYISHLSSWSTLPPPLKGEEDQVKWPVSAVHGWVKESVHEVTVQKQNKILPKNKHTNNKGPTSPAGSRGVGQLSSGPSIKGGWQHGEGYQTVTLQNCFLSVTAHTEFESTSAFALWLYDKSDKVCVEDWNKMIIHSSIHPSFTFRSYELTKIVMHFLLPCFLILL